MNIKKLFLLFCLTLFSFTYSQAFEYKTFFVNYSTFSSLGNLINKINFGFGNTINKQPKETILYSEENEVEDTPQVSSEYVKEIKINSVAPKTESTFLLQLLNDLSNSGNSFFKSGPYLNADETEIESIPAKSFTNEMIISKLKRVSDVESSPSYDCDNVMDKNECAKANIDYCASAIYYDSGIPASCAKINPSTLTNTINENFVNNSNFSINEINPNTKQSKILDDTMTGVEAVGANEEESILEEPERTNPIPDPELKRVNPIPDPVPARTNPIPDPVPARTNPIPDPELKRVNPIPDPVPARTNPIPDPVPVRTNPIPDPNVIRTSRMTDDEFREQRTKDTNVSSAPFDLSNQNTRAVPVLNGWIQGLATVYGYTARECSRGSCGGGATCAPGCKRDSAGNIKMITAYGYDVYNPKVCIISLPYSIIQRLFGVDVRKSAANKKLVKDRSIEVINLQNGKRRIFSLGDFGPSEKNLRKKNNVMDLSQCAARELGVYFSTTTSGYGIGGGQVKFRAAPSFSK